MLQPVEAPRNGSHTRFIGAAWILAAAALATGCVSGRATAPRPQCVIAPASDFELLGTYRNPPVMVPFGDGRYWYLVDDFSWEPAGGDLVTVPKGFVTDFASVPRLLWALLPKWDGYGAASVLHDYLYWSQHTSRHAADRWMKEAMADMGVGSVKRGVIFVALRLFGGAAWANNASRRRLCEVACLAAGDFPLEATVAWPELRETLAPPDGCPAPWLDRR